MSFIYQTKIKLNIKSFYLIAFQLIHINIDRNDIFVHTYNMFIENSHLINKYNKK